MQEVMIANMERETAHERETHAHRHVHAGSHQLGRVSEVDVTHHLTVVNHLDRPTRPSIWITCEEAHTHSTTDPRGANWCIRRRPVAEAKSLPSRPTAHVNIKARVKARGDACYDIRGRLDHHRTNLIILASMRQP